MTKREEYINWLTKAKENEHGEIILSGQAVKDIVELLKESHWIPCSERLPKYDGELYLVTDYCEQINRKRVHISCCYVNREGFWSDVPIGYKVIAWMPLPEPWRGEEE